MSILKIAEAQIIENNIEPAQALASPEITDRFVKLAQTLRKIAPRSSDFLYFTAIFLHASEAALVDLQTGEPKKDRNDKIITGGFDSKWKWSCSDPNILPYYNQNRDTFPESELKLAYSKWIGKPLCVNHVSNDVEGVRGLILDAHYDDKFKRVVGLCAVDSKTYPDLAHKIKSGYANSVSMGTAVSRAICAKCQNEAITEKDYCDCMRQKNGEINVGLSPIELSLVVTPADQQAKVLKIIASMNNYVDQRNSMLEEKKQSESTKLAKLDESVKSIESTLNNLLTECSDTSCRFVKDADGHIKVIKTAEVSWKEFVHIAKQIDSASDYDKKTLFDQLTNMSKGLKIAELTSSPENMIGLLDVMGSKNKYLKDTILNPIVEQLKSIPPGQPQQPQSMQPNQFTSPDGADKDLGISGDSEVMMPASEQQSNGSGARISKTVNPSEKDEKVNLGGEPGPLGGSASDKFQFGNMASVKDMPMEKGGKKTANIDENLNLLLQQTREIENEMNKIKNTLKTNIVTSVPMMEDIKMNEARLKIRSAKRHELLKQAEDKKVCEKCECNVEECKCEPTEKKAYWLGTTEPTPGKPQYKPDFGGEPKNRMNDKQMKQDKSMGGNSGMFPGDEPLKKKELRAELEDRAMKRRAYWLGTTEPTPGKPQYKSDFGGEPKNRMNDKQMKQDKSMGGNSGMFPGDEATKKKVLRAEIATGTLRTKFTKVRNDDGSINKQASYLEVFAGAEQLLKATAEEIYGDELENKTDDGRTNWDMLSTPEYGKEVMATIRSGGFEKVAELLKGAQAMPEMPPAVEAPAPDAAQAPQPGTEEPAKEEGKKVEVDANKAVEAIQDIQDKMDELGKLFTGESEDEVKPETVSAEAPEQISEEDKQAQEVGQELKAALLPLAREIHGELDRSADELALVVDYMSKSASLSDENKMEFQKLAAEALADGQELLEEAETILVVAGKLPPGLKAFQDKKKGKGKGKDKEEEKEDKKSKKDVKKDKKEKDEKEDKKGKKSKKAEIVAAIMKLAEELENAADDVVENAADDGCEKPADDKETCGMCGMAMDKEHCCTASAEKELVKEALAARKAKREAILKVADEKYNVVPDTHGLLDVAHPKSTETHVDNKPIEGGAVVETLDQIKQKVLEVATAVPTGKQGAADVQSIKEAEVKTALTADIEAKKAEEDKTKFRIKVRRAYDLGLEMQKKDMISHTKEALDKAVDDIMRFGDVEFESYKRLVASTKSPVIKTASAKVPQMGLREDNSRIGDNADEPLQEQLKKIGWK